MQTVNVLLHQNIYMLFASWEVRIAKNCDRGLENAARGRRPRAAFSRTRSTFFAIQTDPWLVNNFFIFFLFLTSSLKSLFKLSTHIALDSGCCIKATYKMNVSKRRFCTGHYHTELVNATGQKE